MLNEGAASRHIPIEILHFAFSIQHYLQLQYVFQHLFFFNHAGVALGLALKVRQVSGDGHAGDGRQTGHLVEFAAGGVAADGGEDSHGELVGGGGGQHHHGAGVAGLGV